METDVLATLIASRCELLSQLWKLSQRQAQLVQSGDMPRLMSLLAIKQKLLNELQKLERHLDVFREQDPDRRVWRSPIERQRCRENAEKCELLLKEIIRVERECEGELVKRRADTAALLQGAHSAARASQAYAAPVENFGSHFDVSCET